MGRRKRNLFKEPKMFSSRIEKSDYNKIEALLQKDGASVQKFINEICRLYISGSITLSGSNFCVGEME